MNLLSPSSNISRQQHSCPNCRLSVSVRVITRIESEEVLNQYFAEGLNRARCHYCGALVEAPVRVRVSLADSFLIDHECVPLPLLDRPEVLEDLLRDNPEGLKRVYSNDELERSIEATLLIEMHRRRQLHGEGESPGS
ncbi:MAG: hypothetical protein WD342_16205 [Verrucomicrobiales bacterium]